MRARWLAHRVIWRGNCESVVSAVHEEQDLGHTFNAEAHVSRNSGVVEDARFPVSDLIEGRHHGGGLEGAGRLSVAYWFVLARLRMYLCVRQRMSFLRPMGVISNQCRSSNQLSSGARMTDYWVGTDD